MPVKGSRGSEVDDPHPDVSGRLGPLCTTYKCGALTTTPLHGVGLHPYTPPLMLTLFHLKGPWCLFRGPGSFSNKELSQFLISEALVFFSFSSFLSYFPYGARAWALLLCRGYLRLYPALLGGMICFA